jgi:hypothetical protein
MSIGMEVATPKGRLGQWRNEPRGDASRIGGAALANDEGQMRSGVDDAPLLKPCPPVRFRPGIPITLGVSDRLPSPVHDVRERRLAGTAASEAPAERARVSGHRQREPTARGDQAGHGGIDRQSVIRLTG